MPQTKICVIIGEGLSERHFFPSLLSNKFGFKPQAEKQNFVYSNGKEVFWFFPFPPNGANPPAGGKGRFFDPKIYRYVDGMIESRRHSLGSGAIEIYYKAIRDSDRLNSTQMGKLKTELEQVFKASKVEATNFEVSFVNKNIESWYISGLPQNFPHFAKPDHPSVHTLLTCDVDSLHDPKGSLRAILHDDLRGAIKLGQTMGEYFDVEKAIKKSSSFKGFIDSLKRHGLIS